MGLFDFLRRPERPDMGAELERFRSTPGAVLLDVRTPEEYAAGHIPGSRNVPLDELHWSELPEDPGTPLFVCCLSGARSRQAAPAAAAGGVQRCDGPGRHPALSWKGGQVI